MGRRSYQSSCHLFTNRQRNWSSSWLTRSVCLSVWGCQAVEVYLVAFGEQSYELRSAVRDNTFRKAVEFPNIMEEESGCAFRCDRRVRRNEVYSFGDSIHDRHNGVMSGGLWKFDHKINTEGVPPCVRNGEQLKLANRRMSPRFRPETKIASTHILADVPRHLGPLVVPGH